MTKNIVAKEMLIIVIGIIYPDIKDYISET